MNRLHLLPLAVLLVSALAAQAEEPPQNPLDAARAMRYLEAVCAIGPRVSGSRGMIAQQKLIKEHFGKLDVEVEEQRFLAPNPLDRARRVRMANLVVRWRPEATRRILLCAHYDTRPFPDQDPNPALRQKGGVFVGANDGGSGTALLMELGHLFAERLDEAAADEDFGVDFAFFDGEELVYTDRDPYFLGSQWFATQYAKRDPLTAKDGKEKPWSYEAAVLFDMVADKDLQLYWEGNSFGSRQSRPIAREFWDVAERLGVEAFIPQVKHTVSDDHLALRQYGGIRAIDVIDFDYPYWHTVGDTPDKCSGESLAKVGWVAWEWLVEKANDQ